MRTIATELVDMSKKAVSGRMPSISPFGPSATCSTSAGTGNEVKTISLCAPTSFGELTQTAPFARNGSAAARREIVHDELVPGLLQIGRHPLAHHAETDKSDAHASGHAALKRRRPTTVSRPVDFEGRIFSLLGNTLSYVRPVGR